MILPNFFIFQSAQFTVTLLAATVFIVVAWLNFDSWISSKQNKDIWKWAGFLVLGLGFLAQSVVVTGSDQEVSTISAISSEIATYLRLAGYTLLIIGQIIDPLQKVPEALKPTTTPEKTTKPMIVWLSATLKSLIILAPLAVGWLYIRRATTGLEKHLRPVAYSFYFLVIFELLSAISYLNDSTNIIINKAFAHFGPAWLVTILALLVSLFILGRWVWHYLIMRISSQIFLFFTVTTLSIFLLVTTSFTFLFMGNLVSESLKDLNTASRVVQYALAEKSAESRASAEVFAISAENISAIAENDREKIDHSASIFLNNEEITGLEVITTNSTILYRSNDPERWGDEVIGDNLLERALLGESVSGFVDEKTPAGRVLEVKSAIPVSHAGNIYGVVIASFELDSIFVDGLKSSTGLDVTLFGDKTKLATTIVEEDGITRLIGVNEVNEEVIDRVLNKGESYEGLATVVGQEYLAVYSPIRDVDNIVIGMLFFGKSAGAALGGATGSLSVVFLMAVGLFLVTLPPIYFVARSISKQLS